MGDGKNMANIADNLKRLLGTEGHNIQEVLENADSIGGGSSDIPYIQFIVTTDTKTGQPNYSVGEKRGITDATNYRGACIVEEKIVGIVNRSSLYYGVAAPIFGTNSTKYCYCIGATIDGPKLSYITLTVTENLITMNTYWIVTIVK